MTERPYVICLRIEDAEPSVAVTIRECCKCDKGVWFANSSPPHGIAICTWCAGPVDDVEVIVTPQQRADLYERGMTDEEIDRLMELYREMARNGFPGERKKR